MVELLYRLFCRENAPTNQPTSYDSNLYLVTKVKLVEGAQVVTICHLPEVELTALTAKTIPCNRNTFSALLTANKQGPTPHNPC